MEKVRIRISEYYGNPSYYSVMPQEIFDILEAAFLANEEFADIDKAALDKMLIDYNKKMTAYEMCQSQSN